MLKQACEGGEDSGCAGAARLYLDGKGVLADLGKTAEFLKRARDGSDAASCNDLGELHEMGGRGVRQDKIFAEMLASAIPPCPV